MSRQKIGKLMISQNLKPGEQLKVLPDATSHQGVDAHLVELKSPQKHCFEDKLANRGLVENENSWLVKEGQSKR